MTATSSGAIAMVAADVNPYSLSSRAWSQTSLTCAFDYLLLYEDAHCFSREASETRWVTTPAHRLGSEGPYRFAATFLILLTRIRMA